MPASPNTPLVLTAIQTKAIAAVSPTYMPASNIIIGTFPDPTAVAPCMEIYAGDDETVRFTVPGGPILGGKIDDSQLFWLEVTIPANDRQAAELELANIRDALTAPFHASATLATIGVAYSGLQGKGKRGFIQRAGQLYRVYRTLLKVRFEYNALMVQ